MNKDEALKLALEALLDLQSLDSQDVWLDRWSEAITAVKEALAQPVQPEERNFCPRCGKRTADLTTIHTCTPPRTHDSRILFEDHPTDPDKVILRKPKHEDDDIQDYKRSWVGLTDEERRVLWKKDSDMWGDELTYAEAIEAKLKEKNT